MEGLINRLEEVSTESAVAQTEEPTKKTETKHLKIFGVELVYLCFLGIITAFIGWFAENMVRLVTRGIIDSRFHVLPFIPVYALIVLAVHLVFGDVNDFTFFGRKVFKEKNRKNKIRSNIICLLIIYAAVFFGELIVGNAWEAIAGVELWDYSVMPFSVTQYAGLIPTLGYGTGAYLLFRFCFCPAVRLLQTKANYNVIRIIVFIFSFLLFADELAMFLHFIILGEAPVYWQIKLW